MLLWRMLDAVVRELGLLILLCANVVVSMVLQVSTRRAAAGRSGPSCGWGLIRTPATRSSLASWQAGHTAVLPVLWWSTGAAVVAIGAALIASGVWGSWTGYWVALTGVLAQAATAAAAVRPANMAARQASESTEP